LPEDRPAVLPIQPPQRGARHSGKPRVLAFFLPQFHPIPENDEWWGPGFTEWTNVARARPLYPGHHQPNLPGELGFYDLRLPETRAAQAELARGYGVSAFCYWHYWFAGRQILQRPFEEVLRSGEPRFPFCLAWANQTWSGIWHGNPGRVLIEQTYPGPDDHERHFRALAEAFADDRYLRVDGKPLFYVLQPGSLPDPRRTTDLWRQLALQAGFKGLYLVGQVFHLRHLRLPGENGFDATVVASLPPLWIEASWRRPRARLRCIRRKLSHRPTVYRYRDVLDWLLPDVPGDVPGHPCVMPNWDNTPRSGENGLVLHDSGPEHFRALLRRALATRRVAGSQQDLLFIKSWNEWAEGNYLEPDRRFGRGYLQALKDELDALGPLATS
jgi:hypothetical protein